MSASTRLTRVFESAPVIEFDNKSKFIFFSDCHRGINNWADDFADNEILALHALNHYYRSDYTYIEIGDGDELWENYNFNEIREAHSQVFEVMCEFHQQNRLYLIWGNHDIVRKNPRYVKKTHYSFYDESTKAELPLFEGIHFYEGLILEHSVNQQKIFVVHGHQADLFGDHLWLLERFFVRHVWRHLQILGVKDPTSAAMNSRKRVKVEKRIIEWVKSKNQIIIAGHTHLPRFPISKNDPLYFNDGSCVHPRQIIGIEIENSEIKLIKWSLKPNPDGVLFVTKDILAGPRKL